MHKTFTEFNEAFNDPFDYTTDKSHNSMLFTAEFGKLRHKRTLEIYFWDKETYVDITFEVDAEEEITGDGDAFRIFATVKDAMLKNLKYLNKYKDIRFEAKKNDKSRVKLYRTIAKQLKRKLGLKSVQEHDQIDNILFIISNNK